MVLKRLDEYVRVYDNAFSSSYCNELIEWFNNSDSKFVNNDQKPRFYESILDDDGVLKCIKTIRPFLNRYLEEVNASEWLSVQYTYEYARIKKYHQNSEDMFGPHVDVTDHPSAKRFLSFLVYLNDVSSGGETNFISLNKRIKPKQGRMVIFPPLWMFPHEGKLTYSNDKYILSTYLHYL